VIAAEPSDFIIIGPRLQFKFVFIIFRSLFGINVHFYKR
jgi:hypothetical protein